MNAHQIQYFPPLPNIPPVNGDFAYAKDYWTRKHDPMGLRATDEEVGQAIAYEAGLSFATVAPEGAPLAAPAWVQGLYGFLDNGFNAINDRFDASIQSVREEFTVLLANSNAAVDAPLYDPMGPFGLS